MYNMYTNVHFCGVHIFYKIKKTRQRILYYTCSLSTVPGVYLPPLPPTEPNIEWVEGGVAATGELTISFSDEPPSAHEVLG